MSVSTSSLVRSWVLRTSELQGPTVTFAKVGARCVRIFRVKSTPSETLWRTSPDLVLVAKVGPSSSSTRARLCSPVWSSKMSAVWPSRRSKTGSTSSGGSGMTTPRGWTSRSPRRMPCSAALPIVALHICHVAMGRGPIVRVKFESGSPDRGQRPPLLSSRVPMLADAVPAGFRLLGSVQGVPSMRVAHLGVE